MARVCCFANFQADTVNLYRLARRHPTALLYPLLVLAVLVGVGVWGVTRAAQLDIHSAKQRATVVAIEAASSYRQRLTVAISPVPSMIALVRQQPDYSFLAEIFPTFAQDLAQQVPGDALRSLQLSPFGVVRLVSPLLGNQAAIGLDLFATPSERDAALRTVASRSLTLAGPLLFRQGGYGVRVRMPIFVPAGGPNATFGGPDPLNPFCGDVCYDPATQTKFWGFATALIDLDKLTASGSSSWSDLGVFAPTSPASSAAPPTSSPGSLPPPPSPPSSRLAANASLDAIFHGYRFRLLAPGVAADLGVIARSSQPLRDPVRATIDLPNAQWILELSPAKGAWTPSWFVPLLVAVVLVAVAVALMLFAVLLSRRQHQALLEALLPREVLQEMVRGDTAAYTPHIMQADTPADVLLQMMGSLLEGSWPELRDVLLIRTTVLRNLDIYRPLNLGNHIKEANLDADVTRALMRQLGGSMDKQESFSDDDVAEDAAAQMRLGGTVEYLDGGPGAGEDAGWAKEPPQQQQQQQQQQHDCDTLAGALALILTPQPAAWYDTADGGIDANDGASDAALPTRGTECSFTIPAPSLASVSLGLCRVASVTATAPSSPARRTVPVPAAAVFMEPVQLSLNVPGHGISCARAPFGAEAGGGGGSGGVSQRSRTSRELSVASLRTGRCSSSSVVLLTQPPASLPAAQPAYLPPAFAAAALIATTASTALDDVLTTGVVPEVPAAAVLTGTGSPHGDGGGVVVPPLSPPLVPVSTASGMLQSQGSGFLRSGMVATNPRSPLGAQRHKRPGQGASLATHGSLQNAGQQYAAGCGNGGQNCLSSTFSSVNLGQSTLPEERVSSRTGYVGGAGGYDGLPPGSGMLQTLRARRMAQPPPPVVIQEVERLLSKADSWQFNSWELRDASQGHPLSCLGFYLMQRAGLISRFKINPVTLARLLRHIEAGYPDNPYHNATHATDVLQTLHAIIHSGQLHVHYVDPLGLLAAYFAAVIHDYGHPGLTNDFLIATSDPLAVRYNDRSPLENHHAAAGFSSLRRPELDVTAQLSPAERSAFRKQVVELVLATDMKQHFAVLSHFNTVHSLAAFAHATPGAASGQQGATNGTATPQLLHHSSRNLQLSLEQPALNELAPRPRDDTERLLAMQVAMKAADLGHLGEELEVHQRWLGVLEEEFFRQGDRERELGLPISPLFDRAKQGVGKSQVGFYDFVALPLVHALSSAFPGTQPLMRCFISNYNHWRAVDGQPPAPQKMGSRKQRFEP